jgi:THO complex subunit 3
MTTSSEVEQAKKRFSTTHNATKEIRGHKNKVIWLAWNSKGKLASGSSDNTARVWNISGSSTRGREAELTGHTGVVNIVQFDPTNPNTLATASTDKSVRLWDLRTNKSTHKISTVGENINLSWRPDGVHIVVSNKDDTVSIIDVRNHKIIKSVKYNHIVNEIKWDYSGRMLFMTTGSGNVEIYDYDMDRIAVNSAQAWPRLRTIQAHTRDLFCIDFDPLGRYFAVGSDDAVVSLWSLPEFIPVRGISRFEEPIKALSFNHDGQFLASASKDMIDITHLETGEQVHSLKTGSDQDSQVYSMAWHPSELLLAYTKDDRIMLFGYPAEK